MSSPYLLHVEVIFSMDIDMRVALSAGGTLPREGRRDPHRRVAALGEFAEGIVRGEEAVQIAETTVDQPFTLSQAYFGVGLPRLRKGDLPQAIAMLERTLGVCQAGDIQLMLPWAASALGYAYALSGVSLRRCRCWSRPWSRAPP